jgi:hypothetical protein
MGISGTAVDEHCELLSLEASAGTVRSSMGSNAIFSPPFINTRHIGN